MFETVTEYNISYKVNLVVPKYLREIEDSFSQELITLWDTRKLEGKIYSLYVEHNLIGYILVELSGAICTIRGFYVLPEYRGKGLGTKALMLICTTLLNYEYRDVVWVNITDGAEKVYLNNGFSVLGKRKDFPDQSIAYLGKMSGDLLKKLSKKLK